MNRKGQVGSLVPSILALVVAIIVLVMGLVILQELRDTGVVDGPDANPRAACNATDVSGCPTVWADTNTSLSGVGDFSDFVPIIVIAVAASVIIGLILFGFGRSATR